MNNRFSKNTNFFTFASRIMYILICLALIAGFFIYLIGFGKENKVHQQESLESALRHDIAECYAIEGFYPPNLSYIESHYGLVYDKNLFFIDYNAFGSNMYPDVTIISISDNKIESIK